MQAVLGWSLTGSAQQRGDMTTWASWMPTWESFPSDQVGSANNQSFVRLRLFQSFCIRVCVWRKRSVELVARAAGEWWGVALEVQKRWISQWLGLEVYSLSCHVEVLGTGSFLGQDAHFKTFYPSGHVPPRSQLVTFQQPQCYPSTRCCFGHLFADQFHRWMF